VTSSGPSTRTAITGTSLWDKYRFKRRSAPGSTASRGAPCVT
jgi:hypothetical protein